MKAGDDAGPIAGAILYLLAGPIIWAGHLLFTYGPQSALCAFRITGTASADLWLVPATIAGVTLLSAVPLVVLLVWPRPAAALFRASAFLNDDGSFMVVVMRLLTALSLAGVLWAGATALILDPCGQLR